LVHGRMILSMVRVNRFGWIKTPRRVKFTQGGLNMGRFMGKGRLMRIMGQVRRIFFIRMECL